MQGEIDASIENPNVIPDWRHFLRTVSHTQDTLIKKLRRGILLAAEIAQQDHVDLQLSCCIVCGLMIHQRLVLSCGHANVCGGCVADIQEDTNLCPNANCPDPEIHNVIPIQIPVV